MSTLTVNIMCLCLRELIVARIIWSRDEDTLRESSHFRNDRGDNEWVSICRTVVFFGGEGGRSGNTKSFMKGRLSIDFFEYCWILYIIWTLFNIELNWLIDFFLWLFTTFFQLLYKLCSHSITLAYTPCPPFPLSPLPAPIHSESELLHSFSTATCTGLTGPTETPNTIRACIEHSSPVKA